MDRRSVSVQIRGREFRIRSNDDEESLRRVARHLDETMARVEQKTGTVDSLGVALLTALNLAREVMDLRAADRPEGDPERIRELIELAEAALVDAPARA